MLKKEYQSYDSVVFLTYISIWIIDENSLVTFVDILQWTPL